MPLFRWVESIIDGRTGLPEADRHAKGRTDARLHARSKGGVMHKAKLIQNSSQANGLPG